MSQIFVLEEAAVSKLRFRVLGLVALASLAFLPAYAQQASGPASTKEALAVLDKLVAAMGGRRILESIKDTTVSGTAEIVQFGLTAPITIYQKGPDKIRIDIIIAEADMTIIQAYDGRNGWVTNPQSGSTEAMPEVMVKEMARQARRTQALLDPRKAGVGYALKPRAAIDGKEYIVLEQIQTDGRRTLIYLDAETYLPYKTRSKTFDPSGAEVDSESYSTNYQKVGGTMVPYAVRQVQNGSDAMRMTVTSVATNTKLDDALFTLK